MSVYLGTFGRVALKRKSSASGLTSVVNPSDINSARKRFSFDFQSGQLLTGDQIEITSTDGSLLAFVDETGWVNNTKQTAGKWYIHVDELGGIRLYTTFANALDGSLVNAIILDDIVTNIPIRVTVENAIERILGQVTGYELNTNRETVDTTALSEEFRSNYSSLMSGSGQISCIWDYTNSNGSSEYDVPHYLLQLALRTEIGSEFSAQLYLKTGGYSPGGTYGSLNDEIWYEINGIITAAAVQFSPDLIVSATADFITTGPVQLRTRTIFDPGALLQESAYEILLDQDGTANLLIEGTE